MIFECATIIISPYPFESSKSNWGLCNDSKKQQRSRWAEDGSGLRLTYL